jgi:hypothetical protein
MTAGRPKQSDPGTLYAFAHQFYWDFRRLDEGYKRSQVGKKKHNELVEKAREEKIELTADQRSNLARVLNEEIEDGRLKRSARKRRMVELEELQLSATRNWTMSEAEHRAVMQLRVPGEPAMVDKLLRAKTAKRIRQICKDWWNWPISLQSVLPHYLAQYASEFVIAKRDSRFPQSNRPSSRLKQLWFLSRALAGAIHGYEPRSAINLVGSLRPEQSFEVLRSARPKRNRTKSRNKT